MHSLLQFKAIKLRYVGRAMSLFNKLVLFMFVMIAYAPMAHSEEAGTQVEVEFRQTVYSSSKSMELGRKSKIDAEVRQHLSKDGFVSLGFDTDPEKNAVEHKTSKVEFGLGHSYEDVQVELDLEINMNDGGGISIGPDQDSPDSFLSLKADQFEISLHPYNFEERVGDELLMDYVGRLFYLDGKPSLINNSPVRRESIAMKTIPGINVHYRSDSLHVYAGIGAQSYLYPSSDEFQLEDQTRSERWESRVNQGLRVGAEWSQENHRLIFEYASHDQSAETGAKLEWASSLQYEWKADTFYLFSEIAQQRAGSAAYNLTRDGRWFDDTNPFKPVYADVYGNRQDWLGDRGHAGYLQLGVPMADMTPYISFKYLSRHFIFLDPDSAERLRTFDESKSHGGLSILGIGVTLDRGPYSIRPEFELKKANNKVFGNRQDLREDRFLEELGENESKLTLYVDFKI